MLLTYCVRVIGVFLFGLSLAGATAHALSPDLTPVGAERAGNAAGTIPPWEGGLERADMPRGFNPFAEDQPRFVITAENVGEYSELLTEGHKALFQTFPNTYKMKVYPTRRSASYPQAFYDATAKNADGVKLDADGYGFCCASRGFPFPVPNNGLEVLWNHVMRYNTRGYKGHLSHAITGRGSDYTLLRTYLELSYVYNNPDFSPDDLENRNLFVVLNTLAPRHKAGDVILVHVPINRVAERERMWVFNRGRGRVQAVTQIGHDTPIHDGLMTHDQVDMFNGPMDRYNVELKGKREMLIPYNSYALYDPALKYEDIIRPGHINQDLVRYELHRVWVVEATVKSGTSHKYQRRIFYVDEDSWLVLAQDMYDSRDEFWRSAEAHPITLGSIPIMIAGEPGVQVHYDLQSRRYVILNMTNEEDEFIEYDWAEHPNYFTPQRLRDFGTGRY